MTPVERLQSAIDKLEQERARTGYYESHGWLVENVTVGPEHAPYEEQSPLTSDDLFLTLHRTIDAQLAILREAIKSRSADRELNGLDHAALGLADAILGGES